MHCSVPKILEFFQSLLDGGRAPATLRVYVAAISSRHALSKQRLSHWVVDVITHAYKGGGHPLPSGVRCHSTRAVSTSWAALRGVPLEDICDAASWTSPCTFSRFYRVNVATPHQLAVVLLPDSERSVTQNPCVLARRFCRNRSSDVTGRYRLSGAHQGSQVTLLVLTLDLSMREMDRSVLEAPSSRIHRTVVT